MRRTVVVSAIVTLPVLFWIALIYMGRDGRPSTPSVSTGSVGILEIPGKPSMRVMISRTEAGFDRMTQLSSAGDTTGITQLVPAGQAFFVAPKTRARVIDQKLFKREVRIADGLEHAGESGWIPSKWIHP